MSAIYLLETVYMNIKQMSYIQTLYQGHLKYLQSTHQKSDPCSTMNEHKYTHHSNTVLVHRFSLSMDPCVTCSWTNQSEG